MQNKFDGRVFVSAHFLWNIIAALNDCKSKDCYDLKCPEISTGKDWPHTIHLGTAAADLPHLQVSGDQETDGDRCVKVTLLEARSKSVWPLNYRPTPNFTIVVSS